MSVKKHWSCDLWGQMTPLQQDNPGCDCSMCSRWRDDRSKRTPAKKKRKLELVVDIEPEAI